jgi:hypothetical protein
VVADEDVTEAEQPSWETDGPVKVLDREREVFNLSDSDAGVVNSKRIEKDQTISVGQQSKLDRSERFGSSSVPILYRLRRRLQVLTESDIRIFGPK